MQEKLLLVLGLSSGTTGERDQPRTEEKRGVAIPHSQQCLAEGTGDDGEGVCMICPLEGQGQGTDR